MKEIILIALVLLVCKFDLYSQNWLPVGTQWTFQSSIFGEPVPDDTYTITGTGVMGGKTCSILEKTYNSCDLRPIKEYFYKENGKLYYYDFDLNDFLLLHDFSAEIGDTIKIPSYPKQLQFTNKDTIYVRIDSISVIESNNLTLKKFHVLRGSKNSEGDINFYSSSLSSKNILIEDIGLVFSFFNFIESGFCDFAYSTPLKSFFIPG